MAEKPQNTGTGLPVSIELAWGLRERPTRGPKRVLSLAGIVAAAVAVADGEGLDALSMSRVAKELDTGAMSLYRYVAAKDELLALMVDHVFGDPPPTRPGEGWRARLSTWAEANAATLRAHPWVVRVSISGPPVTPNQLRWMESGLAALAESGLTPGTKVSIVLLISAHVRSSATLLADLGTGEIMPAYSATLRKLLPADDFPELTAVVAAGTFDQDDGPDVEFHFGLERILDGVAALIG